MAEQSSVTFKPGEVIAGRYQVLRCLGTGSMGLVYSCKHLELHEHVVAVKVLYAEVAKDEVAAARFRNEIFASYGVSHPNVVRAYEYLKDGDLVAYSMEYVEGCDLADMLDEQGKLQYDDILSILLQMIRGVQAIHAAGIVHRDLKPENILVSSEGDVKITDFGIARTSQGAKLTEHGGVVGTIDYVSPEYILNSQLDNRSDIYALGVLAYEMVTGELPFQGESVYSTMTKRLESDPEPPKNLRGDCPQMLNDLILKALAIDPEQRYQSAEELESVVLSIIATSLRKNELIVASEPSLREDGEEPTLELQPMMVEKLRRLVHVAGSEQARSADVEDDVLIAEQYVSRKEAALSEMAINDSRRSTVVVKNPLMHPEIRKEVLGASQNEELTQGDSSHTVVDKAKKKSFASMINIILCVLISIILGVVLTQAFFPDVIGTYIR